MFFSACLTDYRRCRIAKNGRDGRRCAGIESREQFAQTLYRQRGLSDRAEEPFSLTVFAAPDDIAGSDMLAELPKILERRLRATDAAGWLDSRRIGIMLSATEAAGAWKMIAEICRRGPEWTAAAQLPVYCYPGVDFAADRRRSECGTRCRGDERCCPESCAQQDRSRQRGQSHFR